MSAGADLAVDLGTTATRVVARGRGLVLELPTVVALGERPKGGIEVAAIGEDAKKLLGRAPAGTTVVRPLLEGRVEDGVALEHFLRAVLKRIGAPNLKRKALLVGVSAPLTDDERALFEVALAAAGVGEVVLVPSSFAAAVGAGLPVTDPVGSMVVDFGGGRAHAMIASLGGCVSIRSVPVGGDRLDEAIGLWLRDRHQLLVAERTTETLKTRVGSLVPEVDVDLRMRVRGRDEATGRPREVDVEARDVAEAIAEPVARVRREVLLALHGTPPEIAGDLVDRGMLLTGAAAKLRGLSLVLGDDTGLPVFLAEHAELCAAAGLERLLDLPSIVERVEILD